MQKRIQQIAEAITYWLSDKNGLLTKAVNQTKQEGFFPRHDIVFQLSHIRNSCTKESLQKWAESVGKETKSPETVLALHAGNLPLVGFQDVIAILLSGHHYLGKISRKDPHLIPSFLQTYKELYNDPSVLWNTRLEDLSGKAAKVMFTGSVHSIPKVKQKVLDLDLADSDAKWLIRKAHFSIAYVSEPSPENMKYLAEAILRFEGKGCRSVGAVIAPFGLADQSCTFTDFLESFWLENPPSKKRSPKTEYHIAFNKAIERVQYPIEHLVFQEVEEPEFQNEDVINWIRSDERRALEIAEEQGEKLQSIYVANMEGNAALGKKSELLKKAQLPDISWKPDGTDTLSWLVH